MTEGWGRVVCGGVLVLFLAGCGAAVIKPSAAARSAFEHNRLGLAAEERGDANEAMREFRLAQHAYAAIEANEGVVVALLNQARVERRAGHAETALLLIERALALPLLEAPLLAEAACDKAQTLLDLQRHQEALEWAGRALTGGSQPLRSRIVNLQARIALQQGDLARAAQYARQGVEESRCAGNRREEANGWRLLGASAHREGRFPDATQAYVKALAIDKDLGLGHRVGNDLTALAEIATAAGEPGEALSYLQRAFAVRAGNGEVAAAAVLLHEAAALLAAQGRGGEAALLRRQGEVLLDEAESGAGPLPEPPSAEISP